MMIHGSMQDFRTLLRQLYGSQGPQLDWYPTCARNPTAHPDLGDCCWNDEKWELNRYGSIPINTIFSGMNIHLPAILMFTRGTRFWHTAKWIEADSKGWLATPATPAFRFESVALGTSTQKNHHRISTKISKGLVNDTWSSIMFN